MTALRAPSREDMLADAWLYALGVTDNARRKLTNQDVSEQPSQNRERLGYIAGLAQWDSEPLSRLAVWYAREGGSDNEFVQKMRREKYLTPAQVRGVCNVMLGDFKRGRRWDWIAR